MIFEEQYIEILKEKYKKKLLQKRIVILSGDEGLGQGYTLEQFISFISEKVICIDLSYEPYSIPLSSVWSSLEKYTDINDIYSENKITTDKLTYMECLFSVIIYFLNNGKEILFYSKNIMLGEEKLFQFIEKIMEYILPKYDIMFLCCNYIDKKSNKTMEQLLLQYSYYINEISFSRWRAPQLKEYFQDRFNNKIKINQQALEQIISAAFGNPNKLDEIIDYLVSENIITKNENGYICSYFESELIFDKMKQYIISRYNNLDEELQKIVKGSSVKCKI